MKSKGGVAYNKTILGAQTMARKLHQQFNLRGGLANNTDISTANPNEWLNCTNAKMPLLGSSAMGAAVSSISTNKPYSMFSAATYNLHDFTYNIQPNEFCVASLEHGVWPSDTVVFSGTNNNGATVNAISVGDKCLAFQYNGGGGAQECIATITTTAKNVSSPELTSTQTILALDTKWTNNSDFISGYIRVGSDSSNYYQWTTSNPGTDDNWILKFNWKSPNSTVGSPNLNALTYVVIEFLATAGTLVVKCSNLRISSFSNTTISNNSYTSLSSNILTAFPYVYDSTNSLRQLIINTRKTLYIQSATTFLAQTDSNLAVLPLKTGFDSGIVEFSTGAFAFQQQFYFSTFPKTGSAGKNILYYTNGNDGYFSYDANAPAGARHAQIDTTAYKYLVSHKNYMWLAGDPANPNTIVPSILSTPGTLDSANAITLNNQDGQNIITGLVSMDDYLLIFRTKDIWIMFGSTTGASGDIYVKKTLSTVGAIHQRAISRVDQLCYFSNGKYVYRFDGNQSVAISEKIKFQLNSASANAQTFSLFYNQNENSLYVSCSGVDPYFNYPYPSGQYQNSFCFIYDFSMNHWTCLGGASDASNVVFGGFNFISPFDNLTYFYKYGLFMFSELNTGSDLFTTLGWDQKFSVQSNWNNLGSPFILKDPDKIRLYITAVNATNTPNTYVQDSSGRYVQDSSGNFVISGAQTTVFAAINFRSDYDSDVVYSAPFSITDATENGFVDFTIGPGCQGHAFSVEVVVGNDSGFPSGNIIYSGYAISWTEAEVI